MATHPCKKLKMMILKLEQVHNQSSCNWLSWKIGIYDLWWDKNEEDGSLDIEIQEDPYIKGRASIFRLYSMYHYLNIHSKRMFVVEEGRKELKRYGELFTSLASMAVHIECSCSLDTDLFIQALQQFIARKGNIRVLEFIRRTRIFLKYWCWLHLSAQKPTSIQSHGTFLGEADSVSTEHSFVSLEHTWKIKWWIIENTAGRNWGYIEWIPGCWLSTDNQLVNL